MRDVLCDPAEQARFTDWEGAIVTLDHPQVGPVRLDREKLAIKGADGVVLVAYRPQPGTDGAEKLALLASSAAPAALTAPRSPGRLPTAAGRGAPER